MNPSGWGSSREGGSEELEAFCGICYDGDALSGGRLSAVLQQPQAQPFTSVCCFNWAGLTGVWSAVAPWSTWLIPGLAGYNEKQIGFSENEQEAQLQQET